MKASLSKRATAWLIDLIIIITVLFIISLVYNPDTQTLNQNIDLITVKYAEGQISFSQYIETISTIYKQIDIKNIYLNIINVIIITSYFIILPYLNNGKTIGKQIQNIEVKARSNQNLSLTNLFIRNLIINGLLYLITIIICTVIIKDTMYFHVITALGLIQITLTLISIIMVLYRKDKKGLHDLIAKTWVSASK